jgi:hypothetical protein
VAGAWRAGSAWSRGWGGAFALAALAFAVPAATTQRRLREASATGATASSQAAAATDALNRATAAAARRTPGALRARALAVGAGQPGARAADAFEALRRVAAPVSPDGAEQAVALFRDDSLVAWAGVWRLRPDALAPAPGVTVGRNPFYVLLHAHARSGPWRSVASTLVHADPPGDLVAAALDRRIARNHGVREFAYPAVRPLDPAPPAPAAARDPVAAVVGALGARPVVPGPAEARERAIDEGRREAAPAILVMALVWVAAGWRRAPGAASTRPGAVLGRRLGALLVPAAALAVAPLNRLSNAGRAFDPAVYYSAVGGQFTSSVGALTLAGLLVLLGLFATLRTGVRVPSRGGALGLVVALAVGAPYLLRELSRGIRPPAGGAPVWLWVAWQLALFVVAAALLTAAAVAGRSVLGSGRGLPTALAPTVAAGAALAGPLLWSAPAGWPAWYTLVWAAAVVALAFTRRGGGLLVAAATVAGLGSATMVWSATARRRVESAERDVRGLAAPDAEAMRLVERLGDAVADSARAGMLTLVDPGGSSLLRVYARSPLASAGNPVALALWAADSVVGFPLPDRLAARVATGGVARRLGRARGRRRRYAAYRGAGAPRGLRRRGRRDRVRAAARPRPDAHGDALPAHAPAPRRPGGRAARPGGGARGGAALHARPRRARAGAGERRHRPVGRRVARGAGDRAGALGARGRRAPRRLGAAAARRPARAHAEVALRPVGVLAARGLLLTLVDVALAGLLWALPALADGALGPARRRWRLTWLSSFRARLTLALLAFSGAPTIAFAAWSYRQLQVSDRESRALLVRETLRDALAQGAGAATAPVLAAASARAGTPLLAYVGGVLEAASEPAVVELAPLGRVLPDGEMAGVGRGGEVTASAELRVAGRDATVGFRSALGLDGRRVVLAAPARADDYLLDRRRRDLGFLVALAAAGGRARVAVAERAGGAAALAPRGRAAARGARHRRGDARPRAARRGVRHRRGAPPPAAAACPRAGAPARGGSPTRPPSSARVRRLPADGRRPCGGARGARGRAPPHRGRAARRGERRARGRRRRTRHARQPARRGAARPQRCCPAPRSTGGARRCSPPACARSCGAAARRPTRTRSTSRSAAGSSARASRASGARRAARCSRSTT